MATETMTAAEAMTAIFGEHPDVTEARDRANRLRGVRLRALANGRLTLSRPDYNGPGVIVVQRVPATVSDAEVVRRAQSVAIVRKGTQVDGHDGATVIAFGEIRPGAILR